jgi:hypothetical protein
MNQQQKKEQKIIPQKLSKSFVTRKKSISYQNKGRCRESLAKRQWNHCLLAKEEKNGKTDRRRKKQTVPVYFLVRAASQLFPPLFSHFLFPSSPRLMQKYFQHGLPEFQGFEFLKERKRLKEYLLFFRVLKKKHSQS